MPKAPKEFDVATVKPWGPDSTGPSYQWTAGTVIVSGYSLAKLIQMAWNVNSDDRIVGIAAFAANDKYDIEGKVPPVVMLDSDAVQSMMKALSHRTLPHRRA